MMTRRMLYAISAAALVSAGAMTAWAGTGATVLAQADEAEPRQLVWDDLMPIGEQEVLAELMKEHMQRVATIREGSVNDEMIQVGTFNVVESLDGEYVRLPGYVIPFSFNRESEYSEFLLVPYAGACIHVPPPPPNQIVYVKTDTPVKVPDIWSPVWATGRLSTQAHEDELGDAAYSMELGSLVEYES